MCVRACGCWQSECWSQFLTSPPLPKPFTSLSPICDHSTGRERDFLWSIICVVVVVVHDVIVILNCNPIIYCNTSNNTNYSLKCSCSLKGYCIRLHYTEQMQYYDNVYMCIFVVSFSYFQGKYLFCFPTTSLKSFEVTPTQTFTLCFFTWIVTGR